LALKKLEAAGLALPPQTNKMPPEVQGGQEVKPNGKEVKSDQDLKKAA
jgi:hypothetical protein